MDIEFIKRQAEIYSSAGLLDKAIDLYERAIETIEKEEGHKGEIHILKKLGNLRLKNGDQDEAIDVFESLLKKKEDIARDNALGFEDIYYKLGLSYTEQGDLNQGLQALERSSRKAKKENRTELLAEDYLLMGDIYLAIGELKEALLHFVECLQSARDAGERRLELRGLRAIGDTYFIKGDLQQALESYKEGLKRCEKEAQGKRSVMKARMGRLLLEKGKKESASENFEEALENELTSGNRNRLAELVYHLGRYHLHEENYDRAYEYSQQGLELVKDMKEGSNFIEAEVLNRLNLANVFADEGELDEALEEVNNAEEAITGQNSGRKRILLGEVHRFSGEFYRQKEEYEESEEHLSEALDIFQRQGDRRKRAKTEYHSALLYRDMDDIEEAMNHLKKIKKEFKDMQMYEWVKRCERILDEL